jgi:hypothetical protein
MHYGESNRVLRLLSLADFSTNHAAIEKKTVQLEIARLWHMSDHNQTLHICSRLAAHATRTPYVTYAQLASRAGMHALTCGPASQTSLEHPKTPFNRGPGVDFRFGVEIGAPPSTGDFKIAPVFVGSQINIPCFRACPCA